MGTYLFTATTHIFLEASAWFICEIKSAFAHFNLKEHYVIELWRIADFSQLHLLDLVLQINQAEQIAFVTYYKIQLK